MAKEICISSTPHETRLAILEDDQLAEIYYERENEYTLAGSIYNGRVTRVLPGMQSAFVDVGLERDAFLYVTDFLELEDQEESDEVEKAASTGGNQAPREVRHANGADRSNGHGEDRSLRSGQKPEQKLEQKPEQRQDTRPDRANQGGQRRIVVEPAPESDDATAHGTPLTSARQESGQEDDSSGKRWRGRRRRRGGRGSAGGSQDRQPGSDESSDSGAETSSESAVAADIQASAEDRLSSRSHSAPAPRSAPSSLAGHAPVPFVLPGESLRKYGGPVEGESPKSAPAAAPARPAATFKPATLVDVPLSWDGSGLLPGESLSRRRTHQPETEVDRQSHEALSDTTEFSTSAPDAVEEQDFFAERTGAAAEEERTGETFERPSAAHAPAAVDAHEYEVEELIEPPSGNETLAEPLVRHHDRHNEVTRDLGSGKPVAPTEPLPESQEPEPHAPDPDASASHRVDPDAPTGFRLPFGLGGKKKTEEPAPAPPAPAPKPAVVTSVSAYAPGTGIIEEEVIEGEEFDAPHHHHSKTDEHDLDDYEEETLPAQIRTGDLGELLQEAHLDHKIQLNFDDKNVEDESFDEEDDDEEDESAATSQPSTGAAPETSQQRRDRGGRGRRGRSGQQAGPQGGQGQRRGMTRRSAQTSDLPIISDLLKPGQEILVQIAKEPIAKKGARITSHIALPGRFLVFMPTVSHIGVSRKIESDEERQRLKRILVHERGQATGGFIVRTAAEGAPEEDLRADLRFLIHLWDEIKTRSDTSKSPALIYHDLSLIERILRDQVSSNFSSIWVDSQDDYERIVRFLNRFSPNLVRRVKLYTKEVPLFEHFGIQDEISKALRSKVWLKSGGSIVINQTEALVAIDINTGKYVGKSARLEDTIVKTNLDAVPEIVRQIRLRDLGGIIVIDFIDMDERKNRFRVLAALEEALKADRAPTKVLQFNDFGLVAITRKRVKQSLERTLSVPCPTCQATGMVKSPTTVCNEIYTELRKMKKHFEGADVLLRVNPETVKTLKSNNASWLLEFEELTGKNILVKSDATLHPEQFDIQG
jgi:Rne/Rng family ribonuclease